MDLPDTMRAIEISAPGGQAICGGRRGRQDRVAGGGVTPDIWPKLHHFPSSLRLFDRPDAGCRETGLPSPTVFLWNGRNKFA
jgi:hypothetical protein